MRKLIFKSIAVISSLTLICGCFSGCSDKTSVKDEKVKIRYMTGGRHDMDIRQTQIEKYNAENKDGIEIVFEVKDDNYAEMLKVSYQSGTAPDIHAAIPGNMMQAAIDNKWLRPIDEPLVKEYEEKLLPGSVYRSPYDGKVYDVLINGRSGYKMIYNKDLFKECGLDPENPPKLWSEVREAAKIITQKGNGTKFGFALPIKDLPLVRMYVLIPGAPSGLYNCDGYDPKTGKYDFDVYKPMINFFKDMYADKSLFPTPDTLSNDTARAQFAEGNIGIMFGAGWDVGVLNDQFPAKCDWGIADFPTFDGIKGGYPSTSSSGSLQMNNKSKDKEKQLKAWQWLISENVLKELQLAGKGPFSLKSILSPEYFDNSKKGAVEFATVTEPVHFLDVPESPNNLIKPEGDNYPQVIKDIIVSNLDTDKEIGKLNQRYNSSLEKLGQDGTDINKYVMKDYNPTTYRGAE